MKNRFQLVLIISLCVLTQLFLPLEIRQAVAQENQSQHNKKGLKHTEQKGLSAPDKESTGNRNEDEEQTEDKSDEQESSSDKNKDKSQSKTKSGSDKAKSSKSDEEEPKLSVTHHSITIGGKLVKYKTTAGYMLMKDYEPKHTDDDKDKSDKSKDKDKDKDKKKEFKSLAKVFFIAYTREDLDGNTKRPIAFTFNGGPGSASIWLHMGGLGPRRAVLSAKGEALPPPYRLEDNSYSWLDQTDLVFIDPVSTGFSRPEPDEDAKKFHGFHEDIESVGDFIRLYITKYKRWSSPKFIIGESYGTTRAAGLSDFLQRRYGIYLNGIVLVSTVLNFATLEFNSGNDIPFALFMPTYTATAWYHKRLAPEMQNKPLPALLNEAEQFASHDYLLSLFEGARISPEKKQEISERLSSFIGLPASYINQLDNRVPDRLFFTHLLMDKNKQLGRYDSRLTGIRYNPGTDEGEFDPSAEAVTGTFTAVFNDYVRRELHFESELPYETIASVWPWNWRNAQNRYLDVSEDLRKAMSRNPYLKVWLCCGHYDLATPYFASMYQVDQMALDPSIRHNVRLTFYESGHMMYIYRPALEKLKTDFESFLKDAVQPDTALVPYAEP